MWTIKVFKTYAQMQGWIQKHHGRYEIREVYISNGYALDVRKLRWVY